MLKKEEERELRQQKKSDNAVLHAQQACRTVRNTPFVRNPATNICFLISEHVPAGTGLRQL